jgi:ATP-dependent RNA helicase DeaD
MVTEENEESSIGFAELGLRLELVEALSALGYEEPTPIQAETIPPLLQGQDLVGQAATGTGKTAAFALPALQRLTEGRGNSPTALVLVPTRELAIQVSEAVHRYGRGLNARVVPIYGGQPIGRQLRALDQGVDIVVATPGRAVDHLQRKTLRLDDLQVLVLDEADEMLDMGFAEELEAIIAATPEQRQTVLFSATMPPRIDGIARRHLRNPVRIEIKATTADSGEAPLVRQSAYVVQRSHKPAALGRVLDVEAPTAALVFCRTRDEVDRLTETLNGRGYRAEALHGGMGQEQRDRVMNRLRGGTADLIVATDVAARGLDIEQLTHVVNYDVPSSPETYVHRIGRVGRAGREGVAITLAEPREHRMLKTIERATKRRISIEKVPTVEDLRTRRLEVTRGALRESILEDDLDSYRVVFEALTDEFDVVEIALAAIKLGHQASSGPPDEVDIPNVEPFPTRAARQRERPWERSDRPERSEGRPWERGGDQAERGERRPWERPESNSERPRADREWGRSDGNRDDRSRGGRDRYAGDAGTVRLYIGVGREAGVQPRDLVGAITGETGLSGREVGAIEITRMFSLVEVPAGAADQVIDALRQATIKGRRASVRRDRNAEPSARGGPANDRARPWRR